MTEADLKGYEEACDRMRTHGLGREPCVIHALAGEVRRLRAIIASAEQNGHRPGAYPICPWCEVEHPAPHLDNCEAFSARGIVR